MLQVPSDLRRLKDVAPVWTSAVPTYAPSPAQPAPARLHGEISSSILADDNNG